MAKELGAYYIDMRPALIHYDPNIWGGRFDQNGVPMVKFENNLEYYPINIIQYGFMLHADWLESKDERKLDLLLNCMETLESLKEEDANYCIWWHKYPHRRYGLKPPWASAMAQGEAISLYLRMYQATGKNMWLISAKKTFTFFEMDVAEGGVKRTDKNGRIWLEEFPSDPPSYVLNGFIYAVFGMYDLFRVTGKQNVKEFIDKCLDSLKYYLPHFSLWYWSLYDLRKKELVRYYYQKNVHVPQMEVLYELTGDEYFNKLRKKWENQLTTLNFLYVRLMYRIRPRLLRLRKGTNKMDRLDD